MVSIRRWKCGYSSAGRLAVRRLPTNWPGKLPRAFGDQGKKRRRRPSFATSSVRSPRAGGDRRWWPTWFRSTGRIGSWSRHGLTGMFAEPTVGPEGLDGSIRLPPEAEADGTGISDSTWALGSMRRGGSNRGDEGGRRCSPPIDSAVAREIAEELDRCNRDRQELEHKIVAEAHRMITEQGGPGRSRGRDRPGTAEGLASGVIGIVASRLAEVYHRPAIVVALEREVAGVGAVDPRPRPLPGHSPMQPDGLRQLRGTLAAAGLGVPGRTVRSVRGAVRASLSRDADVGTIAQGPYHRRRSPAGHAHNPGG